MKTRLWNLLLVTVLVSVVMTGCRAVESGVEAAGDTLKQSVQTPTQASPPVLPMEEAQKIALDHAGCTADQVTGLHTEYEIEDGRPIYDVEFRYGAWEYDYEIHADTGEILSFSKDD